MIGRTWRGWTTLADACAYVEYLNRTGIPAHRARPGNRGAWILRRPRGDGMEFITLTFWDSMDAVRAFAGDDPDQAVFYPEDDRFLVDRERTVRHFELLAGQAEAPAGHGPEPAGQGPESAGD
jgi:heme-degrading monooxygenase HmoA